MLENIISFLQNLPGIYVILLVFLFSFIENIFPPSPSDSIIVFSGTLIPLGNVHILSLLIAATAGSSLGFLVMYLIGMKFDKKIIETGKLKYIKIDTVLKVEHWFQKWGYWIIVINRFLSGTRAVISFFAGMSLLDLKKTTILATLGALVWNFVLIYSGMVFSENWREIYEKIDYYGYFLFGGVIVIAVLIFLFNKFKKKTSQ